MPDTPERADGAAPEADDPTAADPRPSGPDATAPDGPPSTPFDHPLFLPALLLAGCVWFGWDAYFTTDPDLADDLEFNRFGLRVILFFTALLGVQGWCELKERAVPPFASTLVHGFMALWFAFDGWLSSDELNLVYRDFNRFAAVAFAAMTGWHGFAGARIAGGGSEPLLGRALLLLVLGGVCGWLLDSHREHLLLYGLATSFLVAAGVRIGFRALFARRA